MSAHAKDRPLTHRLMFFDLAVGGHHPSHIGFLARYWRTASFPGRLDIVVLPEFARLHYDVVPESPGINLVCISPAEAAALSRAKGLILRGFQEWTILCRYARILDSTHALLMYLDRFQAPLALGLRAPCALSGIYFRPSFHYADFVRAPTLREQTRWSSRKLLVRRVLQNPSLQTLFCLDPYAVWHMAGFASKAQIVALPDPVEFPQAASDEIALLRERLGIAPEDRAFLLFGSLTRRKGVHQLLKALSLLSPSVAKRIVILLIGRIAPEDRASLVRRLEEVQRALPARVIVRDEFVSDDEASLYFLVADIVLAVYQRHIGSSGILLRAAAALKPVLASDYGLMGELVRRHALGLTIDSSKPAEIARGMEQMFLAEQGVCDREKMRHFAEQNSPELFAKTIFNCLFREYT